MKYVFLLLGILTLIACRKPEVQQVESFGFRQPSYFPDPVYSFGQNQITKEKYELGRALFFSPILSSDNTISCASCHDQPHAFADHNVAFSSGVNGQIGTRNAPAIFNLAWQPHFMWDGGVNHLEVFSVAPITNALEMNESMASVIEKLNASEYWKSRFKTAYNADHITDQMMLRALTQYMLLIISDRSKYDEVRKGKAQFTEQEQSGYNLFLNKCASCHTEPLFTDHSFRNNGLDQQFSDAGRALITQNDQDNGKFKVPTLRNVMLTYPYMHDGRFYTINDVLEHYSTGVQHSATLDPVLENGIPLTQQNKEDLKAFLRTLTDDVMLADPTLSRP